MLDVDKLTFRVSSVFLASWKKMRSRPGNGRLIISVFWVMIDFKQINDNKYSKRLMFYLHIVIIKQSTPATAQRGE